MFREAQLYSGNVALNEPYISPIFGNPDALPPMLIQVASSEVMRSDATAFYRKALERGVHVQHSEWEGVFHGWQLFAQFFPKAQQALGEIASF